MYIPSLVYIRGVHTLPAVHPGVQAVLPVRQPCEHAGFTVLSKRGASSWVSREERERDTTRHNEGQLEPVLTSFLRMLKKRWVLSRNAVPNKTPPYYILEVLRGPGWAFPLFLLVPKSGKVMKHPSETLFPECQNPAFPSFCSYDYCILSIVVLFAKLSRMLQPLFPMSKVVIPAFHRVENQCCFKAILS